MPRRIDILMAEPILPRILSTASWSVRPCTGSPSSAKIRSPRLDAGLAGRRVVDRRHDLDHALLHRDLDAEAAELAARLDLHVLVVLGVHVARVRIERGQHAVDGVLDQRLLVHRLDIVAADAFQHVAEQVELLVELALVAAGRFVGLVLGRSRDDRRHGQEGHGRGDGNETQTVHREETFTKQGRPEISRAQRGIGRRTGRLAARLWRDQGMEPRPPLHDYAVAAWAEEGSPCGTASTAGRASPRAGNVRSFPWAAALSSGPASSAQRRPACHRSGTGYWPDR